MRPRSSATLKGRNLADFATRRELMTDCAQAAEEQLLERLREICKTLPGAEEYVMVHHPAFRVRKKPFVVVGLGKENQTLFSVNLGRMEQVDLLEDERFHRTPYMGHNGWVSLALSDSTWDEVEELVIASYRRVAGKRLLDKLDFPVGRRD